MNTGIHISITGIAVVLLVCLVAIIMRWQNVQLIPRTSVSIDKMAKGLLIIVYWLI